MQPHNFLRVSEFRATAAYLSRRKWIGRLVCGAMFGAAAISVLITTGIVFVLLSESLSFFSEVSVLDFLTDTQWTPVFRDKHFGIVTLLSGTFMSAAIALGVAVPVGLVLAVYLSEFASHSLREIVKPVLELLEGIPTVAFGYFCLFVATPLLQMIVPGLATFNLLVPGLVMGIMILPYVVSLSEDSMRAVPGEFREAGFGLGMSRLQVAFHVVVPAAHSGISTAIILGMSRAIGETMVVAIAAGQNARIAYNPLEGAATITSYIVQITLGDVEFGSLAYRTIFAAGLTLFTVTVLLNLLAFWLKARFRNEH